MTFLVSQTKSYTLVVSGETGEMRLELADELKENLSELLAEADTSTDGLAAFLDVLGADAAELLNAMGELYGVGGELAGSFANGGPEALEATLTELAATGPAADIMDRLGEKGAFGGFGSGFVEMPGSDVEDILGYGFWDHGSQTDPASFSPTYGLTQDNPDADWMQPEEDNSMERAGLVLNLVSVGTLGAVATVMTAFVKAVEQAHEAKQEKRQEVKDALNDATTFKNPGDEVTFIPADPDAEYAGIVDFKPHWQTEEALDATYGQILTDPNNEGGVSSDEEPDPEAELAKEILTDPEAEAQTYTVEGMIQAATANIVQTTLPVDPDEPEFDWNPNVRPDMGGGEDFTGALDGEQVMAGATEYIILLNEEGEGPSEAFLKGQMEAEEQVVEHIF